VAECVAFGDHHRYSRGDVERMATTCRERGAAAVLTTDKDATRLRPLRPLPVPIHAVPLVASVEPHDSFRAWLLERLAAARGLA
jgi:tetraacyldisaccharide-1-P 4'-kinase